MARHDREESLEEQLAWLDAIKEQEEAPPVVVTAQVTATMDDAVISPYPQDPWSLVPAETGAVSSPLFRTAADPDHAASAADTVSKAGDASADRSAEEADAAEWTEAAEAVSSFTLPPAPSPEDNDGFLAPLKPLPRPESDSVPLSGPGSGDTYALGAFGDPEKESSRGLFEEPRRPDDPAESSSAGSAESSESGNFGFGGGESDTGRFGFGGGEPSETGRFGFSGGEPSEAGRFGFSSGESETGRFGFSGDKESDTGHFGSSGDNEPDRPAFDGGESETRHFGPGGGPDSGRFTFGGADAEGDRFTRGDTDPGHFGSQTEEPLTPMKPFRLDSSGSFPAPEASGSFQASDSSGSLQAPGSFGADRSDPAAAETPERPFGSGGFASDLSDASAAFGRAGEKGLEPDDTAFVSGRGAPFTSDQDRASDRDRASASTQDTPFRASEDTAFIPDRDRETAAFTSSDRGFAPDREAVDPVREPYQARRRQPSPPPAFSSPARQQAAGGLRPSADSLDPESLLRGRRNGPSGGWRKLIFKASAGLIKPGESPEVRRRRELITRARTPVATGHHRVAVLSLKGGVGKTTTTVGLGATLAQARGDRVIAVDANPDRGTLSDKLELETAATVRDLLNERGQIKRYVDIRAFTSQAPSRLEILASDRDPSVSEAFSASDYQSVAQVLENFYSICITDCGTGLLHSAMSGVLGLADQLVLVSSPSVDGARAASATLDWLEAHHYEDLVRSATVVLCSVRPRSKSTVDLDRLEAHFAARCRAVIRVPYDPHLEEGAEIDLERLQPATRDAYLCLAASVGDGFAAPQS
ncbi:nucleotide-binding protein [Planomonospora algeriensis]